jgi:hypothetical protein
MNQKEHIESLELELRGIDEALARIPALDKPTRRENIEHAIRTAGKAHDLETKNMRLEKELETALDDLRKTRMAHADIALGVKKALGIQNWPDDKGLFRDMVSRLVTEAIRDARSGSDIPVDQETLKLLAEAKEIGVLKVPKYHVFVNPTEARDLIKATRLFPRLIVALEAVCPTKEA